MCGIAGILERDGLRPDRAVLLAMAGELHHRGPDGSGLYCDGPLGMVNTRLSIVDVAGGDQPLSNEDGRYWVMQNGEIYNYPELIAELSVLGHRFATRCDTEVIVHAYEEWGSACVERFIGAFAFAIWDRTRRELFVARDRLGVRPLFIAEIGTSFLFASEAKALLRHPKVARQLDPLALYETFEMWGTAPDRSAFVGVRELDPGHHLLLRADGRSELRRYWDVPFGFEPEQQLRGSDRELAQQVYDLLEDATRLRLRADVPVGAYLSGGLDSSGTAAIVRRLTDQKLHAFALGFEDPLFDETPYQERMARELQVELASIMVKGPELAAVFPRVVHLAEKPLLRTAPAPLLLLSKLVHDAGFKVVLTGEGADEVFAGYDIFKEDKVRRFWAKHPGSRLRPKLFGRLHAYLAHDVGRGGGMMHAFFGRGLREVDDPLYSHLIRFDNTRRCQRFLAPGLLQAARALGDPRERLIARLPAEFMRRSPLARAQYLEIVTFLQGYLLHSQGDRMLMGNAVEGRFPFLDHRLFELAARLPDSARLRVLEEKFILRRALAPILPDEITRRVKKPYRAPILRAFIGRGAPEYVSDLLSERSLQRAGLFDPAAVAALRAKCQKSLDAGIGETDEMALCGVLSGMLLHQQFIEDPIHAAPVRPTRVVIGAQLQPA
jgi:asparagine synthase (glutamine-hydrolysing)